MTLFISIRYLLEFFLFKIIIFLLFPFSKKISSKIVSNSFMFLGKFSKYNQIAKNNCKMVFPNLNETEITKINGELLKFGNPADDLKVSMTIKDESFNYYLIKSGSIGLGECYMKNFFTLITGCIIFYPVCFVSNPVHAILMGVTMHYTQYLYLTHKVFLGRKKNKIINTSFNKYLFLIIFYSIIMSLLSLSGKSTNEMFNFLIIIPIIGQMLHFYLDSQLWKFSKTHNRENTLRFIK